MCFELLVSALTVFLFVSDVGVLLDVMVFCFFSCFLCFLYFLFVSSSVLFIYLFFSVVPSLVPFGFAFEFTVAIPLLPSVLY